MQNAECRNRNIKRGNNNIRVAGKIFLHSAFLFLHLSTAVHANTQESEADRISVVQKISSAVVAIFPPDGSGGGSGVLISPDGYVLTNFHVVGTGTWHKCGLAGGKLYDSVVVGIDPVGDVALIKMLPPADKTEDFAFPYVEFGDSDSARQGDEVLVLGNPFGFATDFSPTVTFGILSGNHRYQFPAGTLLEYADCLQVDASINPGNSGGPLFDIHGKLIGINGRGSFEKRGRVNVGVGYAISINQIKRFLGHLRAGRIVDHATLGATVETDDVGRAVVSRILDDSDAFRRGLRETTQITSFGGRRIHTANDFKNILGTFPKGWITTMTFSRKAGSTSGASTNTAFVRLQGVHSEAELIGLITKKPEDMESPEPRKRGERPAPRGEAPEDSPERPLIPKIPGMPEPPAPPEMPENVKSLIEERHGWANYHFNRLESARVWNDFNSPPVEGWLRSSRGGEIPLPRRGGGAADGVVGEPSGNADHPALTGTPPQEGNWNLEGTLLSGSRFSWTWNETQCVLKFPASEITWPITEDFTTRPTPPDSEFLLPGMTLWRRLLTHGPHDFGVMHYWGFSPLPYDEDAQHETLPADRRPLFDVLSGSYGGLDVRFFFSRKTSSDDATRLVMMELTTPYDEDCWEFRFRDYRHDLHGHYLPGRVEVRCGEDVIGEFLIEKLDN